MPDPVRLPLTAAQSALWFAQQLDPTNPSYTMGAVTTLDGPVDGERLARAFAAMSLEAQALRARFVETADGVVQEIAPEPLWSLSYVDLSGEPDPEAAARALMDDALAEPAALDGPLGVSRLFRLGPDRHLWFRRAHHLLVDGFASVATANRTAELYTALARGEPPAPAFGPLAALVEDDLAYQDSAAMRADREFWLSFLDGRPEPVRLGGRPGPTPHRGRHASTVLDGERVLGIDRAAARAGVTWPRLVIATVVAYLHRMTGAHDIVVGLPVAARLSGPVRAIPGCVSNVVPLRCVVTPGLTLAECARRMSDTLVRVLPHQRSRTERLRRDLGLTAGERLFGPQVNVMPFYGDVVFDQVRAPTTTLSRGPFEDMSIVVSRHHDGRAIELSIDADPDLYRPDDLSAHLARLAGLLGTAERQLDTSLGALDLVVPGPVHWERVDDLSDEEVDRLLEELADQPRTD